MYKERLEIRNAVLRRAGSELLPVITVVDDPRFLSQPFTTSTTSTDPDGSKWAPLPCEWDFPDRFLYQKTRLNLMNSRTALKSAALRVMSTAPIWRALIAMRTSKWISRVLLAS
jgi:hypothetical protein